MTRLSGKTALVTGGGGGLGAAISTALAAEGAHVLVVDRLVDSAEGVVKAITDAGGSAEPHELDIADRDAVLAFGARVLERHERVDVLVNNAGVSPRIREADTDVAEKWDHVLDINLTGQYDVTVSLLPGLRHQGASVIFLSSIAGFSAPRSSAAYGATKAGVRSLVQYFSRTLGPTGGRCNGLAPGRMKSGLMTVEGEGNAKFLQRVPLGRVGETNEIAGPAVFLASDMSSYVTGVTIPVDGGYLAL
ncbi:short-chain dehydrogenase [Nocardioides sp. Root1257]|uniref:SDR family NAD(P)-dependent oxidoreductase n=1 Tax=unclassified Nocardioides TaxID=2615069 RepID=UPI0006F8F25D|nr:MULTISPECIES: SDR family NAD(P)-dependent oxidoreductase [unclassified Nocardioides]KQW45021.1 short-chain dehydrogenase [Nocardioides sp. Root1257]KRC45975.1 short-chain dehydrogenase [Nocardioides sp. Root224]